MTARYDSELMNPSNQDGRLLDHMFIHVSFLCYGSLCRGGWGTGSSLSTFAQVSIGSSNAWTSCKTSAARRSYAWVKRRRPKWMTKGTWSKRSRKPPQRCRRTWEAQGRDGPSWPFPSIASYSHHMIYVLYYIVTYTIIYRDIAVL